MNVPANINLKPHGFYLAFFLLIAIGSYLRLDQFTLQVLLDDEWHVIHQLLYKTPLELFQTFGEADFSIPLALFYWLELKLFGLSELAMRWPMMLAGISALIIFPLYSRNYIDDKATLVFLFLLAISPRLILFSRTARPYTLTLLLSLCAIAAFQRFIESERLSLVAALFYFICAVASTWLHLVSLPLVVAPFLVHGLPALFRRDWNKVRRMLYLGLVTLCGLLLVLLPPMLAQPEALSARLSVQLPEFQTYYGVLFVWMGTASLAVVSMGVLFAFAGAGPLWRKLPMVRSVVAGLGLTLAVILLTRPAWVHNPVTLARYVLPAIPLFLLSVAVGISRVSSVLISRGGGSGKYISSAMFIAAFFLVTVHSPLPVILASPNSNSLHSVYQFDFRKEKNLIYQYQKDFPISPFWQQLASLPADSVKIAASPFYFETHHWDAARWEQLSQQRVMPGFVTGFCSEFQWGEVPLDQGFNFKNVGYLSDQSDLIARGFDLVVYQKPFKVLTNQGEKEFGKTTAVCEQKLREEFQSPVYEDQWLLVFPLSDSVRSLVNATR